MIMCGDIRQSDLDDRHGKHDLNKVIDICRLMDCFEFIHMTPEDIVRSGFVKDFILACEEYGY